MSGWTAKNWRGWTSKIWIVVVLLMLGGGLGLGCSSDNHDPDSTSKPRIRFWHFWSEPAQRQVVEQLVRAFERETGCYVEISELSWNDGKAKLFAAFNAGTAPDVLELGSDWIAQFSSAGVLADLTDAVDLQRFLSFTHPPAQWQGRTFAVPWIVDTRVLFINDTLCQQAGLMSAAPSDVRQWYQWSERLQQLPDVYGTGVNGSDPHRLYKKVLPFLWSNGGDLLDSNGMPTLDRPENIEAVEAYAQFADVGLVETQRRLDDLFIQGKVGFWVSGSWLLERIPQENPDLTYHVALIPPMPGGISQSFAGGEYLAISKDTEHYDLALRFVQFLTRPDIVLRFCQSIASAGFPADTAIFNHPSLMQNPYKVVFAQQLRYARMTPVHPQWLEIEHLFETAVTQVLYGQRTAERALRDAQQQALKLITASEETTKRAQ